MLGAARAIWYRPSAGGGHGSNRPERKKPSNFNVFGVACGSRSGDRGRRRQGARSPARRDRADRVREHRQQGGARGAGLGAHQQIRGRVARPALLRRLPVRGHRGNAGDRTGYQAFRMQVRERAAAFRRVRQRRRLHGVDGAGRYLPRAQSRGRRSSDPWIAGQPVGALVQAGALQRAPRRPPHRHRRGAQARAGAPAQGDHRRRERLSARHRFPRLPRNRGRSRRQADGRHGAFRRTGGRRRASVAVPACACGHFDRAQDAARPALGLHPQRRRGACKEDQLGGVPRPARRSADACDRGQGGGVRRGIAAVVQGLRQERRRERQGAGRDAEVARASTSSPAAPTRT